MTYETIYTLTLLIEAIVFAGLAAILYGILQIRQKRQR